MAEPTPEHWYAADGLFQFAPTEVQSHLRPGIEKQIAAGTAYMRRYYDWMQRPVQPGDWAKGGVIEPGHHPASASASAPRDDLD